MNESIVNGIQIIFALICIVMGIDKFAEFLPTCSLLSFIPKELMWGTGVLEIGLGLMILLKKQVPMMVMIGTAVMAGGVGLHLATGTFDISVALISFVLGLVLIYGYKTNKNLK